MDEHELWEFDAVGFEPGEHASAARVKQARRSLALADWLDALATVTSALPADEPCPRVIVDALAAKLADVPDAAPTAPAARASVGAVRDLAVAAAEALRRGAGVRPDEPDEPEAWW
jgi:hypothetical protein